MKRDIFGSDMGCRHWHTSSVVISNNMSMRVPYEQHSASSLSVVLTKDLVRNQDI